jgi:hypothetical protein
MREFLKGKKTYIVMVVGVIVHGMHFMGYIDDSMVATIDGALLFLGLGTIRGGISKV